MMSALTVVSNPIEQRNAMERLLVEDSERWCAIMGIMAVLALPIRPLVEIETDDGWAVINFLAIHAGGVTFYSGTNGSTMQHVYRFDEAFPQWRPAPRERPTFPFGHHR